MRASSHTGTGPVRLLAGSLALSTTIGMNAHADLVANYDFQDSLDSSVAGAPALQDLGSGEFVTNTVGGQSCRVFKFEEQTGLSLDIGGLLGGGNYTFVAMMRLAEVNEYAKILDIHDRVEDEGLYAYENDLIYYDYSNLALEQLAPNTWAQVALTFNGSRLKGYVNGVLAFNEPDTENDGAISASTLYFFRDDNDTDDDENSKGRVANIQLYDEALSASAIAALSYSCGADVDEEEDVPAEPVPALPLPALAASVIGVLLLGMRRLRRSSARRRR